MDTLVRTTGLARTTLPITSSRPADVGSNKYPGDEFHRLVEQFYQPIYRYALGLARNEAQAADLTQQTFYLWARHGHHQLRDRTRARGWLYTTLHREFLRDRRRGGRFAEVEPACLEGAADPAGTSAVDRCDGGTVIRAVQEVDEPFRTPLRLFYLEGRSYGEIAGTLGVPVGTVMSRLSRGKAQLRARLRLSSPPRRASANLRAA